MALANIRNRSTNHREGNTMNSENIAATSAQERIDAVEVQERLFWPSAPANAYCDTWLMINAGALNFKASEEHQVAAMANIGHQLLQEIAAYRPAFKWTTSPAEIVGALIEEMAAPAPPQVPVAPLGDKRSPIAANQWEEGALMAAATVVACHDMPVVAASVLCNLGLSTADCSALDEFDKISLRKVQGELHGSILLKGLDAEVTAQPDLTSRAA